MRALFTNVHNRRVAVIGNPSLTRIMEGLPVTRQVSNTVDNLMAQ